MRTVQEQINQMLREMHDAHEKLVAELHGDVRKMDGGGTN